MERPAGYSSLRRLGDLKHSWRSADHDGWVLVDGRTIVRSDYPKFFQAIGLSGDTFTFPVATDGLIVGAGGRLKVSEVGGSNALSLTPENLPPHDHDYVDTLPNPATDQNGLLSGVVKVMTGVVRDAATKQTAKAGAGKPVAIEPYAIGANLFVYVGRTS